MVMSYLEGAPRAAVTALISNAEALNGNVDLFITEVPPPFFRGEGGVVGVLLLILARAALVY